MDYEDSIVTEEGARRLYSPLNSGRFRLIRINPNISGNESDSHIRLVMTDHVLDDSPEFTAFSYEWGNRESSPTVNAYVNGEPVVLRSNLQLALERFRKRNFPGYLWIDALCINQRDKKEKEVQVRKMHTIYSTAARTFVWLGPSTNDSAQATEFLGSLDREKGKEAAHTRILDAFRLPAGLGLIQALQNLFKRSYWTRAWIVQEMVFGSTKLCLFACGDEMYFTFNDLSWFSTAPTLLDTAFAGDTAAHGHLRTLANALTPLRKIVYLSKFWDKNPANPHPYANHPEKPHDLLSLLSQFRKQLAKLPCDKVYSLLNICSSDQSIPVKYDDANFTDPILFKIVAIEIIKSMKSFAVFHACTGPTTSTPSWAPDWGEEHGQAWASDWREEHGQAWASYWREKSGQDWAREMNSAGGQSYDVADFIESNNVLHTKAHIIGQISDLQRADFESKPTTPEMMASLYKFVQQRQPLKEGSHSEDDNREILRTVHTLLLGPTKSQSRYPFEQTYKDFLHYRSHQDVPEMTMSHFDMLYGFAAQSSFFQCKTNSTVASVAPVPTLPHEYELGTARRAAEEKDWVAAIPGCGYLVILREAEKASYYKFVCLAYMEPYMKGEALVQFAKTDIYIE